MSNLVKKMFSPTKKKAFAQPGVAKTDETGNYERATKRFKVSDEAEASVNRRVAAMATYKEVNATVQSQKDFNILELFVQLSNDYLLDEKKSVAQKFGCLWYFSWLLKESHPDWVGDGDDVVSVHGHS